MGITCTTLLLCLMIYIVQSSAVEKLPTALPMRICIIVSDLVSVPCHESHAKIGINGGPSSTDSRGRSRYQVYRQLLYLHSDILKAYNTSNASRSLSILHGISPLKSHDLQGILEDCS